jgi:hypothetical protein
MMPLRNLFLAILLYALPLAPAFAAIGTIDSLDGDVRIVTKLADRAAKAGLEISEGDTLKTGDNAWALLAMSDGASITLRPNSQVKFDTYRYDREGDTAKNTSVLSLVKGALRSVTGYIGRTNRAGYRIDTPTATIGIRGTDHEPAYYPPPGPGEKMEHEPGTYDKVNEGLSFVRNPKGEITVKPGQFAFVHHNRQFAPRHLDRLPAFYHRHQEFDRHAEERRKEFHRKFEDEHKRWREERERRGGARGEEKREDRQERFEKGKQERFEKQRERGENQRREQFEQRKQEHAEKQSGRREQIEQRRDQRAEELKSIREKRAEEAKSRRQEREEKHGGKKGREDDEERRRR